MHWISHTFGWIYFLFSTFLKTFYGCVKWSVALLLLCYCKYWLCASSPLKVYDPKRDTTLFSSWRTFIPRLISLGAMGIFTSHFRRYKHLFIKYKFQKTCWHCPITFTKASTLLKTNKSFWTGDYKHSWERAKIGKLANCVLCCWGDLLCGGSHLLCPCSGWFFLIMEWFLWND